MSAGERAEVLPKLGRREMAEIAPVYLTPWNECWWKHRQGEMLTALETFIFSNEPAMPYGQTWREQLSNALIESIRDHTLLLSACHRAAEPRA